MKDIEYNYDKKLGFGYKDELKRDLERLKSSKILNGRSKKRNGARSFLVSENMMNALLKTLNLATVDNHKKLAEYIISNFPEFILIVKRYRVFTFKIKG